MDEQTRSELVALTTQYFQIALSHVGDSPELNQTLRNSFSKIAQKEAELPGFEHKPMRFGKFENRDFVVMMTDIRKSTEIINAPNGTVNMFLIFYVYAGVIAKIVDKFDGTSTEFLGDGVLSIFDPKEDRNSALLGCAVASRVILEARVTILNPFFSAQGLPTINLGIGIDYGMTIVTQFGYRSDTDLKAFGQCVYNASKLCKGFNVRKVSGNAVTIWPTGPEGKLRFDGPEIIEGKPAYTMAQAL